MLFQLAFLFVLVMINGLFVMAELALVGARRTLLQAEAAAGNKGAAAALALLDDTPRLLSTASIGITLIGVIVSTVGGDSFVEPLATHLADLPLLTPYARPIAIGIVVVTISFLTLVLGELVPKRIALSQPERLARALAPFMAVFSVVAAPAEWVLSAVSDGVLWFIPISQSEKTPVTDDEINLMMREGAAAGEFSPGEGAIVQMALRLGDRRVDSLMTPRTQVEWLDIEDGWEINREKILTSHLSRFPVVDGGPETVLGIVQVKDLLPEALSGSPIDLRHSARPPLYVPNTVPALQLLETLKKSGEPMAMVVDEYGDLDGIVTVHDIFQALVGDIAELGESEDQSIVRREDGSWLIDGLTPIDDVKDAIGIHHLPGEDTGDFHTLGGFIMAQMKRVPNVADHIHVGPLRFEVVDMDGHRVDKVMVARVG